MMNNPLVTVVTVAYNSEGEIEKTIKSVLSQSYKNIEYRIVDGGSKDRTVEIARSYAKEFEEKGISYIITSEPDTGIYDAMNKGIRAAEGEFIGFINAGDMYESCAVETAVDAYEETGFDYFFADIKLVRANGSFVIKRSKKDRFVTSRHWNHPTSFVAKRTYDELGIFRCRGIHDDFEFYLRCRKSGRNIVIVNKVLAEFVTGGASNEKSFKKAIRRIKDRYECYRTNGYSPFYMIECIAIEAAKMLMV